MARPKEVLNEVMLGLANIAAWCLIIVGLLGAFGLFGLQMFPTAFPFLSWNGLWPEIVVGACGVAFLWVVSKLQDRADQAEEAPQAPATGTRAT
jgi:hypothetical protein